RRRSGRGRRRAGGARAARPAAAPFREHHAGLESRVGPGGRMARAIVVAHGGRESRFAFQPIDRSKLYGARKRMIVDENGEPCIAGYLAVDGSVLLLPES